MLTSIKTIEATQSLALKLAVADPKYAFTQMELDVSKLDDYGIRPTTLKAVGQSPEFGSLLAPGSTVIVYFEDTDSMTVGTFKGVHVDLAEKNAKDIVGMAKDDEAVKKIIEAAKESKDLTPAEEVIISEFLKDTLLLEIDETNPLKTTESAYNGLLVTYGLMQF